MIRYGDSVDNTDEENSSIFSLIWMRWLPWVRAWGQENFAPTKSSSFLTEVDLYNGHLRRQLWALGHMPRQFPIVYFLLLHFGAAQIS